MFPLCTRVTDFRPLSIAYRIAFRTRRFEPVSLTGLPSYQDVETAVTGHILGEARLIGTYQR